MDMSHSHWAIEYELVWIMHDIWLLGRILVDPHRDVVDHMNQ